MRRIVAGNWKMNLTRSAAQELYYQLSETQPTEVEVYLLVPYLHMSLLTLSHTWIKVGAQDCSDQESGAFTGETSASMLAEYGAQAVLVGHSERRARFGEKDDMLRGKIAQAQKNHLEVIYCVGESDSIRAQGEEAAWHYVEQQLFALENADLSKLIIAYEPIWAIGTGKSAQPSDAGWMCSHIAEAVHSRWGVDVPVLYGGSCNPGNAKDIFAQPGVSGGLIGGASLKAEQFLDICRAF